MTPRSRLYARRVPANPGLTPAEQSRAPLKEQIMSACYLPGEILQESQICGHLGMGRTPVRQALQRLG